jgi:hypothetical protein
MDDNTGSAHPISLGLKKQDARVPVPNGGRPEVPTHRAVSGTGIISSKGLSQGDRIILPQDRGKDVGFHDIPNQNRWVFEFYQRSVDH